VRNVSRGTDNRPVSFGVSVTFRCLMTDDVTSLLFPFDVTVHVSGADHRTPSLYKTCRSLLQKIWRIVPLSINWPSNLDH